MARPSRPWFRFYVEAVDDTKLRTLPPPQRWLWVVVLACARSSPEPGRLVLCENRPMTTKELADKAAISVKDVAAGLAAFTELGMIAERGGVVTVCHWEDRQFETDDVTSRTQRHRSKNVPGTFQPRSRERSRNTPESESESDLLTSSDNSRAGRPPPGDGDDLADTLGQACLILAGRDADRHTDIRNRTSWVRARARSLRRDHADESARHLAAHPDSTAEQLAAYLAGDPPARPVCPDCAMPIGAAHTIVVCRAEQAYQADIAAGLA